MKLRPTSKSVFAAALGLAFSALTASAALIVNVDVSQTATFGSFVGGANHAVSNNGSTDINQVITTGTPIGTPFSITYDPLTGPSAVTLITGTLNTTTFVFNSTLTPLNYFSSVQAIISTDFDNDSVIDLVQSYSIKLAPFTSDNGFTGVRYSIVPSNDFGDVIINGINYAYASVVSNSVGILFDNQSTEAAIQFQFRAATPVPEPSTFALAGVAALGCIVGLRRRRSGPASSLPVLAA